MSNNYDDLQLDDLFNFDGLDDLLKASGLIISKPDSPPSVDTQPIVDTQPTVDNNSSSNLLSSNLSSSNLSSSNLQPTIDHNSSSQSQFSSHSPTASSWKSHSSRSQIQFPPASNWKSHSSRRSQFHSGYQSPPASNWKSNSYSPPRHQNQSGYQSPPPPQNIDDGKCGNCHEPLYMKVTLPCGHEFCFNCIKGQIIRLKKSQTASCLSCYQPLSKQVKDKIISRPQQLNTIEFDRSELDKLDVYWFYSSRGKGWWSFDIPSTKKIELIYQKYSSGENITSKGTGEDVISICGMDRIFDFHSMLQINDYNHNSRQIKRVEKADVDDFMRQSEVKGLAGYRDKL